MFLRRINKNRPCLIPIGTEQGVHLLVFQNPNDPNGLNTMLAETVEQWTKDWKQQGFEEGLEQGIRQGEASVLKRQLIWRFKVIAPEMLDRIEQAMPEQLEQWLDNLLEADTLEAVFKGH